MRKLFIFLITVLITIQSAVSKQCPFKPPDASQTGSIYQNHLHFYIDAQNGNDSWNGLSPTFTSGSGPFKTFPNAIQLIRNFRAQQPGKAVLFVKSGTYVMYDVLQLDNRDNNLWIVAYPGDTTRPQIIGGQSIPASHFTEHDMTAGHVIYKAPFTDSCSQHAFSGGKRLFRARKPNLKRWNGNNLSGEGDYLIMENLLAPTPDCNIEGDGGFRQDDCLPENRNGFKFKEGDIISTWHRLHDVSILVFQAWVAERGRISSVAPCNRTVLFQQPLRFPIGRHPKPSGFRYVLENVFEELDTEGEYYCDPDAEMFYAIFPGNAVKTVYVSQTPTFFRIRNADTIVFEDVGFRYSYDNYFSGFNNRPAVIDIENCNHVYVERCQFRHIGYTAIYAERSTNITFSENSFFDIGNVGVAIEYNPNETPHTSDVEVVRNTLCGCGVIAMLQPTCIHVKGRRNIVANNNEISNVPYAGMRVGWQLLFTEDFVPVDTYVFDVSFNHIFNYGRGILNDFGGIYLSSNMVECGNTKNLTLCHIHARISNNIIHDSSAFNYGAVGIYGDSSTSSILIFRNWLYKLMGASINFSCGLNNKAVNNMVSHDSSDYVLGTCNGASAAVSNPADFPPHSLQFEKNVFYVANTEARLWRRNDAWSDPIPLVNTNCYYLNPTSMEQESEFWPVSLSFEEWKNTTSNDLNSIIADPRFRNRQSGNLRLMKNSPASQIGIRRFRLRKSSSGAC